MRNARLPWTLLPDPPPIAAPLPMHHPAPPDSRRCLETDTDLKNVRIVCEFVSDVLH
jgi:hypothetical protein